jgi:hypothetical protein
MIGIYDRRDEGKDVYFYFDNDQEAFAVFNALTLKYIVNYT